MVDVDVLNPYLIKISYFYEEYIPSQINNFGVIETFESYFNSIDCKRWDKDHNYRLTQTISHIYRSDLSCCMFILDNYVEDDELYESLLQKLINRHLDNLEYEKDNPCVPYKGKIKNSSVCKPANKAIKNKIDKVKSKTEKLKKISLIIKPR